MRLKIVRLILIFIIVNFLSASIVSIAATKTNALNLTTKNTLIDDQNIKYISVIGDNRFKIDNVEYDEYIVTFSPTKKIL